MLNHLEMVSFRWGWHQLPHRRGAPKAHEESDCEHHVPSVLQSRRAINRKQRRKLGDKTGRENPSTIRLAMRSSLLANSSKLSGHISNTTHPS